LTGLARHLFGDVEMRWREDYFPFTEPSFELDIFFNGDWMEVLGCGVIHDEVMANAGKCSCGAVTELFRLRSWISGTIKIVYL
jgi:phenylalanyl-tRNA synthetase alpha subunit